MYDVLIMSLKMATKIAVLLSGGVDSSVALALLHEQGYQVVPFYLKIWLEDELSYLGECPWAEDIEYAQKVCAQLGLELQIVSLQEEYRTRIINYIIDEVKAGRTPNPDILCNTYIKFGAFLEKHGVQFDKVATGHYAGIIEKEGIFFLKRTPDEIKDQTYFLSRLSQAQLSKICFPLADFTKEQIRALASSYNLANKDRKDSQGLCFLGKITFSDFIKAHVGVQKGALVEYETGNVVGSHEGFWFYTHGQRQGIGLSGGPWYVVDKDPKKNIVFISKQYYNQQNVRNEFYMFDAIGYLDFYKDKKIFVKIRHGKHLHHVQKIEKIDQTTFCITIVEQDQGIAPGQFAVFYDDRVCIGSGIIGKKE